MAWQLTHHLISSQFPQPYSSKQNAKHHLEDNSRKEDWNVTNTSAKLSGAFREISNRRADHEATCAEVKKVSQRTAELKRKATEAHEKTISHREGSRRITNEHTRSEAAVVNHSFETLVWCVKETAAATHSLTCGIPDRENNEIRYLKQATAETTSRSTASDRSNLRI